MIISLQEVSSNAYLSRLISVKLDDLRAPPDELLPGRIPRDLVRPGPGSGLEYVPGPGEGEGCRHHEWLQVSQSPSGKHPVIMFSITYVGRSLARSAPSPAES